jgi:hypothetical protein
MDMMRTAIGFRVHSGWAAVVAAAGTLDEPRVLDRRRIVIADAAIAGSKQPYHSAAAMPFEKAEAFVHTAAESARALAAAAIAAAVEWLRTAGYPVAVCGMLTAAGRPLPGLAGILASHSLIHTAEGELFRDAVSWGARQCGLPVTSVREKDISADAFRCLPSLAKKLGPPWTLDEKLATVAALIALNSGR